MDQRSTPAFPTEEASNMVRGMTLRDYFAAKAMQGLIDGYDHEIRMASVDQKQRTGFDDTPGEGRSMYVTTMAEEAYIIADAMLKARDKR